MNGEIKMTVGEVLKFWGDNDRVELVMGNHHLLGLVEHFTNKLNPKILEWKGATYTYRYNSARGYWTVCIKVTYTKAKEKLLSGDS